MNGILYSQKQIAYTVIPNNLKENLLSLLLYYNRNVKIAGNCCRAVSGYD